MWALARTMMLDNSERPTMDSQRVYVNPSDPRDDPNTELMKLLDAILEGRNDGETDRQEAQSPAQTELRATGSACLPDA